MIYIQSINQSKTLANHFDCSCALYGAVETAEDYRLVTYDEVVAGKLDSLIKRNLFVGSVEFMKAVFERVGKTDVKVPVNSNRKCEIITLEEAYKRVSDGETKLFIKPIEIKLFTGFVLDKSTYTCLKNLPKSTMVMAYEAFYWSILSEWRVYVHNHKMVDSRNYAGDFTISPNYLYIESVIKTNKSNFPCAYTIDIGINIGANVVIEFNDMWAIGNYGMPNDLYLRLLKDRYFEIINKN